LKRAITVVVLGHRLTAPRAIESVQKRAWSSYNFYAIGKFRSDLKEVVDSRHRVIQQSSIHQNGKLPPVNSADIHLVVLSFALLVSDIHAGVVSRTHPNSGSPENSDPLLSDTTYCPATVKRPTSDGVLIRVVSTTAVESVPVALSLVESDEVTYVESPTCVAV